MTKVRPGEEVEVEPRRAIPPKMRARVIARTNGLCAREGCGKPVVDVDHIVPRGMGGRTVDANLEGLCKPHHDEKTAKDVPAIAKAKRRQKKNRGEKKPNARSIKSKGFDKTKTMTRGFDGRVRPRKNRRATSEHD